MKCQLHPPSTRTIFGMIPWMFWTLLAAVLFSLLAPFAAVLLRADPEPSTGELMISNGLTPLRTKWGDDLAKEAGTYKAGTHYEMIAVRYGGTKAYEMGLRSDGVVVWREVKP